MTTVLAILIALAAAFVLYHFLVKHKESKELDQATYNPPAPEQELKETSDIVVEVAAVEAKVETHPAEVVVEEVAPKKAKKAKAKAKAKTKAKTTKSTKKPKLEVAK